MRRDVNMGAVYAAPGRSLVFFVVALACYALFISIAQYKPAIPELLFVAVVMLWTLGAQMHALFAMDDAIDTWNEVLEAAQRGVDPWEMQRSLMQMSDQRLPVMPRLHNGMLLYAALQLEELAEQLQALCNIITTTPGDLPRGLNTVNCAFFDIAHSMDQTAIKVRAWLPTFTCDYAISVSQATSLLDGTTDLAVVNCGFALSAGLPGGEAYVEVLCSNQSKANPVTGKIDKTADGKWIKGANYFPPNLFRVLVENAKPEDDSAA